MTETVRFLIYSPVGVKTGGPECLYQLCDALNNLNFEAWIVQSLETKGLIPSKDFEHYNVRYFSGKFNPDQDVLIVPETAMQIPRHIIKSVKQIVVWWLSVDNSPLQFFSNFEKRNFTHHSSWNIESPNVNFKREKISVNLSRASLAFKRNINSQLSKIKTKKIDLSKSQHVAQSFYAKSVVESYLEADVHILSDYIFDSQAKNINLLKKHKSTSDIPIIVYNPLKGFEYLAQVMELLKNVVQFVSLENMSTSKVRHTLATANLYLDLGHFPGKDRIPREAILEGTPVVLAARGAARNDLDLPIPNKYKIDLMKTSPENLSNQILEYLNSGQMRTEQKIFFEVQLAARGVFFQEVEEFARRFSNEK